MIAAQFRGAAAAGPVARLYSDLDNGFTPLNFMLPNVPFPANARRDAAQLKLSNLFVSIIKERRAHPEQVGAASPPARTMERPTQRALPSAVAGAGGPAQEHEDMLNTLMNAHYKSGEPLKDHQVANLMIALLMAGQHTSSATLSWLWAQLTAHPEWQYGAELGGRHGRMRCRRFPNDGTPHAQMVAVHRAATTGPRSWRSRSRCRAASCTRSTLTPWTT